MLFAHLKRILQLGRLRLRRPSGVRDEFPHTATAQNLKNLAKPVWKPPGNGTGKREMYVCMTTDTPSTTQCRPARRQGWSNSPTLTRGDKHQLS